MIVLSESSAANYLFIPSLIEIETVAGVKITTINALPSGPVCREVGCEPTRCGPNVSKLFTVVIYECP